MAVTAHPRSRGENPLGTLRAFRMRSSSPLTRGKPPLLRFVIEPRRLIPAHAGKTCASSSEPQWSWAHPRSRGENSTAATSLWRLLGSSPLTRGKRGASGPAWRRCPAHPRSRGENLSTVFSMEIAGGSSPLTRGKQAAGSLSVMLFRLIPAHAGKTSSCRSVCGRGAAHPRSRGENCGH